MFVRLFVAFFASIPLAQALVLPGPQALPNGTVKCGSNAYKAAGLQAAINAAVDHLNRGDLQDDYPHQFRNDEGVKLWCTGSSGPWYEYPILASGAIYVSPQGDYHSPGADRVIFTGSGVYCAAVTHTGASGNAFLACDND